jgi:nitroreductase
MEVINKKANAKRNSCINCGHCIAVCPTNAITMDDHNMDEIMDYKEETFQIDPGHLLNFIKFRRSVRRFKNQEIPEDVLKNIMEAGRFTATGSNRQNVSYIVVQKEMNALRSLALKHLNEMAQAILKKDPSNSAMVQFARRWEAQYLADQQQPGAQDGLFYNATALILLVSDSPVDASLAASNMELLAAAQGIGSFYGGFFMRVAQHNREIKETLGIQENQEVMVCMALGYPDVTYLRTVPRKEAEIKWM